MKLRRLIEYTWYGGIEARERRLDKEANWTPLLIYVHTTRLTIGFALGVMSAIATAIVCGVMEWLLH